MGKYKFHILLDPDPNGKTEKKMLPDQDVRIPDPIERTNIVIQDGSAEKIITAVETAKANRPKKFKYKKDSYNPKKHGQSNIIKW